MSYGAITDLQTRISDTKLKQLTDFADTGQSDQAKIQEALDYGAATIDSYSSGRYTLPLKVSKQIKDLEITIAIYKLYEGRQMVTEQVRQSYEDAILFLKDVSAGKASLDQPAFVQSAEGEVITKDHDDDPDAFDDLRLADYMG